MTFYRDTRNISEYNREELLTIFGFLYQKSSEIDAHYHQLENLKAKLSQKLVEEEKSKLCKLVALALTIFGAGQLFEQLGFLSLVALPLMGIMSYFLIKLMFLPQLVNQSKGFRNWLTGYTSKKAQTRLQAVFSQSQQAFDLQNSIKTLETAEDYCYYLAKVPENFSKMSDLAGIWGLLNDFRANNFQEAANVWRSELANQAVQQKQKEIESHLANLKINIDNVGRQLDKSQRLHETVATQATKSAKDIETIKRKGIILN